MKFYSTRLSPVWRFSNQRMNALHDHAKRLEREKSNEKTSTVLRVSREDIEYIEGNPVSVWEELNEDGLWEDYWQVKLQPINSYGKDQGHPIVVRSLPDRRIMIKQDGRKIVF